jgi:sugar phosphate isomerase/epimerase
MLVYFTKELKGQTVGGMIDALRVMKCDGADLCVRDGYAINPDNALQALPAAVKTLRDAGLSVPMVSAATDLTDPNHAIVDRLLAACHDAGVPLLKPGYWHFQTGTDYAKRVDAVRRDLEQWEKKAMMRGVKIALHTHSGTNMGLNASAMLHLVKGFNPAHIGVYLDTAHLLHFGEPLPMAADIVREYLCIWGIKDSLLVRHAERGRTTQAMPLGEGMVDWRSLKTALQPQHLTLPLTLHTEYKAENEETRIRLAAQDFAFLRILMQTDAT